VQVVIRRLVEADVEPVVDFSLAAWEPVFAGISSGVGLAVLGTGGDDGHAPARALYESLGFRPFRHVRYYKAL
jgi:hypothetical protein